MSVSRLRHRTVVSLFFCETLARHSTTSNANQKGWFATTLRSPFRKLRLTMRTRSEPDPRALSMRAKSPSLSSFSHFGPCGREGESMGQTASYFEGNFYSTTISVRSPFKSFWKPPTLECRATFRLPNLSRAKKSNGSTFALPINTWYALLIH